MVFVTSQLEDAAAIMITVVRLVATNTLALKIVAQHHMVIATKQLGAVSAGVHGLV